MEGLFEGDFNKYVLPITMASTAAAPDNIHRRRMTRIRAEWDNVSSIRCHILSATGTS
jgi:hypothetical protein